MFWASSFPVLATKAASAQSANYEQAPRRRTVKRFGAPVKARLAKLRSTGTGLPARAGGRHR
jgi:hypothetical protein